MAKKPSAPSPVNKDSVFPSARQTVPMDTGYQEADGLQLHAQPQRRKTAAVATTQPVIAACVFVVVSTGSKGKIDILPLHEVPLLRRKIALQEPAAEVPRVLAQFPEHLDRLRGKTALGMREEYDRLLLRYKFDKPNGREGEEVNLVADFYGQLHQGRLLSIMRRLEAGWKQIKGGLDTDQELSDEQLEELVGFADPDFDMASGGNGDIDYRAYEPHGPGSVVG